MSLLFLSVIFPFISFLVLVISRGKFNKETNIFFGICGVSLSFFITLISLLDFLSLHREGNIVFVQELFNWIKIGDFCVPFVIKIDCLSLLMIFTTTIVGLLIHIYSSWYMSNDNVCRFFAYTNLFIFFMLLMILSDNLVLFYFGWEGISFCSYLLVGFYYKDIRNSRLAIKSLITTRISDIFLILSFLILYRNFGILSIQKISLFFSNKKTVSNCLINFISLMMLIGIIGKSAQFPFHKWLIYSMVGPTPVSALVHSSTIIMSGVYLMSRMYRLFIISYNTLYIASIIGAITLIFGGISALFQNEIKKVLAYSTISQIGFVFLSIGNSSFQSAIYYLVIHSFSKSLLFLSSGSLIKASNNEGNISKISISYKELPFIYLCLLIGSVSLSSFPFITSSFYLKEKILFRLLMNNNICLLLILFFSLLITPAYIFRIIFTLFYKKTNNEVSVNFNASHYFSLIVLMFLSIFSYVWYIFPLNYFSQETNIKQNISFLLYLVYELTPIFGLLLTLILFINYTNILKIIQFDFLVKISSLVEEYYLFFKTFCEKFLNLLYKIFYKILLSDPLDNLTDFLERLIYVSRRLFSSVGNTRIHWYILSMVLGIFVLFINVLFLTVRNVFYV